MLKKASLSAARTSPIPPGRRAARLFSHGSMGVWFYAPHGADLQTPHDQDEVYIIVNGTGSFFCAGERVQFGPGDALFVPANAEHRFEEFGDDLEAWVVFYGPKGGESAVV